MAGPARGAASGLRQRLRRHARRLRQDTRAAFPVFEAILVAILVFTAMIFVTSIQRPTTGKDSVGVDLGRLSGDQLEILRTRTYTDPADSTNTLVMEEWVARILEGDQDVATDVDADIRGVLKGGLRYTLRLDNGIDTIHLLPPGPEPEPRAGRAAQLFFLPNWTAFSNSTYTIQQTVAPGDLVEIGGDVGYEDWTDLRSPWNSTVAPHGGTWLEWWDATEPELFPDAHAQKSRVPLNATYGTWRYDAPGCDDCYLHVGLPAQPGATETHHAVYGLQMVVWFGA